MRCPDCGTPLQLGSTLCTKCGLDVRHGKKSIPAYSMPGRYRGPLLLLLLFASAAAYWWHAQGLQPVRREVEKPAAAPRPVVGAQREGSAPVVTQTEEATLPAPVFDRAEFLRVAAAYETAVSAALDKSAPAVLTNGTVVLRLKTGLVIRGSVAGLTDTNVTVEGLAGIRAVSFRDLTADDRLACDANFRTNWIHMTARVRARSECEDMAFTFPDAVEAGAQDAAVDLADPVALYNRGRMYLDVKQAAPDASSGFMYMRLAALGRHLAASYTLGRLYYSGTGVTKNDREAVKWLSAAAARGFGPAQLYLDRIASSQAAVAAALNAHRARFEREKEEYAARLESARTNAVGTVALASGGLSTRRIQASPSLLDQAWWNGYWIYGTGDGLNWYYDEFGRKHTISGHR